ncbi:glycosyltransferase family 4 protein [Terrabacter sp. GCM10028922]|uniref:glycosyltransferase family 4 protein n=1 Tax=Terrabacter sp. GCM10028922 TaxID=3273428 RepID=UPI003620C251
MTHVAIDARVPRGISGGVAQVVMGLAQGFREASIEDLERTWIVDPDSNKWLDPLIPERDGRVVVSSFIDRAGAKAAAVVPNMVSSLRPYIERLRSVAVATSSGASALDRQLHRRGVQVVHLPFQEGISTDLPTIYHPHDLQHVYLPRNFTRAQIERRETVWRDKAEKAYAVSVGTKAVANDITHYWGIPDNRVFAVPLAPVSPLGRVRNLEAAGSSNGSFASPMVLYPAGFWPHKNHETLVRALGRLAERGVPVRLKLPGAAVGNFSKVRDLVVEIGLDPRDVLPGYVSDDELAVLFDSATLVAVPSLFESASFPVWEAFMRSKPVVVARTTSLPQQVGEGGIVVDPLDDIAFADAIGKLIADPDLRSTLGERGAVWASQFSWRRTVLSSCALYRRAAGHEPREREELSLVHGPFI